MWEGGPEGLELPDLKMMLDRSLNLARTVKTQKLRAYLAALPHHFCLEDYLSEAPLVCVHLSLRLHLRADVCWANAHIVLETNQLPMSQIKNPVSNQQARASQASVSRWTSEVS